MNRTVLGIDLGTTYSCVAHLDEYGRPQVLPNLEGALTTPSVVYFEDGGNVVIGETAKNEFSGAAERVVSLFKRHMGEEGHDFEIDGERYLPQKISAVLLRYLVTAALGALGVDPPQDGALADVVITVPAYFGAGERQATRDAGTMAGLNVLNIINEPTAAAIAYGLGSEADGERSVLVYDLGGGTFDVTVITVAAERIRVIATDGDHQLGGADWDNQLADLLAEKFIAAHPEAGDPRLDEAAAGPLTLLAETAKKNLSSKEKYRTAVTAHGQRATVEITRDEYEERTAGLIERTIEFTANLIEVAAAKGVQQFDAVLLVGGMSKSLAVTRGLSERFPDLPTPRLTDPDHIVAKGAALFAANSRYDVDQATDADRPTKTGSGGDFLPGPTIINVSSKGYGVRVVDGPEDLVGHVEWLVQPNDELPAAATKTFHTVSDNQAIVNIEVYESFTADLARELESSKKLIDGELKGLPPRKPAGQPIDVDFALGDDGILRITARSGGQVLNLTAEISGATAQEEMDKPLPSIQY